MITLKELLSQDADKVMELNQELEEINQVLNLIDVNTPAYEVWEQKRVDVEAKIRELKDKTVENINDDQEAKLELLKAQQQEKEITAKENLKEAGKIACLNCDEVSTVDSWRKNNDVCPKCNKSTKGVAESLYPKREFVRKEGLSTEEIEELANLIESERSGLNIDAVKRKTQLEDKASDRELQQACQKAKVNYYDLYG